MRSIIGILSVAIVLVIAATLLHNYYIQEPSTATQVSSSVIEEWLDLTLTLTKETPGFTPPVAARAFGYTSLSAYESVRFGIPNAKSLAGQLNEFDTNLLADIDTSKTYDWNIVANANFAAITRALYPNTNNAHEQIAALEATLHNRLSQNVDAQITADSIALGRTVAEKIALYAASDGQSEAHTQNFPTNFFPPQGEGLWVPTPKAYDRALQPLWGDTRPFLTQNIADALPPPPPMYSLDPSSQFYIETKEVYDTVQTLTDEQRIIAEFWSDDPGKSATPPGHSVALLRQILATESLSLGEAVIAYAKLGIGLHDAFISCWYAKYTYGLVRPITVIHEHIDPSFVTPVATPPFPEYPSGHSVQSGATAQILADIFGEAYPIVDRTHETRTDIDGTPRAFDSFTALANEAAMSRLYGGIHYRAAIEEGVTQGRTIGENIRTLSF